MQLQHNDFFYKIQTELSSKTPGFCEKDMYLGKSIGTFGELLQGVLPNDKNFLVTLPIQKYSHAIFVTCTKNSGLIVYPKWKTKSLRLARVILSYFDLAITGQLYINSEIEEGKGMASSSADLIATAAAIQECHQLNIPIQLLERFIRMIEPSDGIMYNGVVSYYHVDVKLIKPLGYLVEMVILGIDEGGQVNTIEFNKIKKSFTSSEKNQYQQMLITLEDAVINQDLKTIGAIATQSALLNQKMKQNIDLNSIIRINHDIGGLGVVIAHSGTCIGILLEKYTQHIQGQIEEGQRRLKFLNKQIILCHTVPKQCYPINKFHEEIS